MITVPVTEQVENQAAVLQDALTLAMQQGQAVELRGIYCIDRPIALNVIGVLRLTGQAAIVYTGQNPIGYMLRISSESNNVDIDGHIELCGSAKARTGIRIDCLSTVLTYDRVRIAGLDAGDFENLDDSVSQQCSGIEVFGLYQTVEIDRCRVWCVRNSGQHRHVAVSGITVSGYHGDCRVTDCRVNNVTSTTGRDADGIKVFGQHSLKDGVYRPQTALIERSQVRDCQGRGIKIQTSEAVVRDCYIVQDLEPTITHGVGVAFQWGNGLIENCSFVYNAGTVGASYSSIHFANLLGNAQLQRSQVRNCEVQAVDQLPRMVLCQEANESQDVEIVVDGVSVNRRGGGQAFSRSMIELPSMEAIEKKTGTTTIRVRNCNLPTNMPIVGYTGYTGSVDIAQKFTTIIDNVHNTQPTLNNARPVMALSGQTVRRWQKRYSGLSNLNTMILSFVHIDFATLLAGDVFMLDLSGNNVTTANGPALPSRVYLVECLAQGFRNNGGPLPSQSCVVRITCSDTGKVWQRINGVWL